MRHKLGRAEGRATAAVARIGGSAPVISQQAPQSGSGSCAPREARGTQRKGWMRRWARNARARGEHACQGSQARESGRRRALYAARQARALAGVPGLDLFK